MIPRERYIPELWGKLHEQHPEVYPPLTIKEQNYIIEQNIRTKYAAQMSAAAAPYKLEERETWFTQLKEADEWLNDNNVQTPLLTAIAIARSITVNILVSKIKENDALFKQVIGTILGKQQAELDLLK
jgi:hypothetical protein